MPLTVYPEPFRLLVWRRRRQARLLSKYSSRPVTAYYGGHPLGTFLHGKEIETNASTASAAQ